MTMEQMFEGTLATSLLRESLPFRGDSTNAQLASKKPLCGVGVISGAAASLCAAETPNTARLQKQLEQCATVGDTKCYYSSPTPTPTPTQNARKMDGAHGNKEGLLLLRCLPLEKVRVNFLIS